MDSGVSKQQCLLGATASGGADAADRLNPSGQSNHASEPGAMQISSARLRNAIAPLET
jgi:hypothetical protein